MSTDFDEAITKKAAINKSKSRELNDAKNSVMAVGTLFAHTSLDYVSHIQIAHARKHHVILEAVSRLSIPLNMSFYPSHFFS